MQVNKEIKVGDLVKQTMWAKKCSLAIITKIVEAHDTYYVRMVWQDTLEEDGCHIGRVILVTPSSTTPATRMV